MKYYISIGRLFIGFILSFVLLFILSFGMLLNEFFNSDNTNIESVTNHYYNMPKEDNTALITYLELKATNQTIYTKDIDNNKVWLYYEIK